MLRVTADRDHFAPIPARHAGRAQRKFGRDYVVKNLVLAQPNGDFLDPVLVSQTVNPPLYVTVTYIKKVAYLP